MCLYPRIMKNKRYLPNEKNKGIPPLARDHRLLYVAVGCGNCIECRQQKANNWRIRLNEELKANKEKAYFVTLTYSPESILKFDKGLNEDVNKILTRSTRLFLERWRKKHKKSVRHWLISELGHQGTERVHMHGIIWTDKPKDEIKKLWSYGWVYIGEYCNQKTINYIVKYVTKIDTDHKGYTQKIFASPGLGNKYTESDAARFNKFNGQNTREYYRLKEGYRIALPIYYRNKIYSEFEREELWLQKLDKQVTYVRGIEIDISNINGYKKYMAILKSEQDNNIKMGYGDTSKQWKEKIYRSELMHLNTQSGIQKVK